MSKQSYDDCTNERYQFQSGARRVQPRKAAARQRAEDVEARINREYYRKTVRKALFLFPCAWIVLTAIIAALVHGFVKLDDPDSSFFDSVSERLGWVLIPGLIGAFLWTVWYFLRSGNGINPRFLFDIRYAFWSKSRKR